MIVLIGFICFFSHAGCTGGESPQPQLIGKPFPTMAKCEEFKDKLDKVITPTEWIDGKFECVEGQDIL